MWPFADWRPSFFDGRNEGKNADLRSPFKMKGEAKGRGPTMAAKGKGRSPTDGPDGPACDGPDAPPDG